MTTTLASPATSGSRNGPNSKDFRYDIGGLRGLAILFVVAGHTLAVLDIHLTGGVDMSFALSGYLITWLAIREFTTRNTLNLKAFYARRVMRLLPAATIVTLATIAASWYWLPLLRLREVGTDAVWSVVSGINYWYVFDDRPYAPAGVPSEGGIAATSPFQHYWSLAVEEQFYLFYPGLLLLALVIGRKIGRLRLTVGIMLAAIVVASFTASLIQSSTITNPDAYYSTHTRVWELGLGALVAAWQPLFKRLPGVIAGSLSWIGLGIACASIWFIYGYPLPGYHAAAPVIGVLLVIIGGEARPGLGAERILKVRPLQYIGKISYQWYLWHWPVLIIMPYAVVGRESFAASPENINAGAILPYLFMATFVSFILAVATWHLIDTPIRNRKAFEENPGKVFGMGVHMFMVTLAAVLTLLFISPTPAKEAPKAADTPVSEIGRLIQEGTALTSLSPTLQNGLAAAKEDWDIKCINEFKATAPKSCTYGVRNAKKTIVMMGDSHTTHWVPAMDAIAKKLGVKLVTYAKSACPAEPYANIDYGTKRRYTECEQWRETVYREVETLAPDALILSTGLYEAFNKDVPDARTIGSATSAVIQRFAALGTKVVVFDDTPRPFIDVPTCLSEHVGAVQECSVPRATAMHHPQVRAAREQAARENGATFIKLDQWFCTATMCPAVINGMIVYVDTAHITTTYVRWLVPELEKVIRPALR